MQTTKTKEKEYESISIADTKQTECLLHSICHSADTGDESMNFILQKANDKMFLSLLRSQKQTFKAISTSAEEALVSLGVEPKGTGIWEKATMWGSIQISTLTNSSQQHLADMLIKGYTMGITEITKSLHTHLHAEDEARQLAKSYLDELEHSIDELKPYL